MEPESKYQAVWLTGATGFVGRRVLARVLASGRRAVCLVRAPGGTRFGLHVEASRPGRGPHGVVPTYRDEAVAGSARVPGTTDRGPLAGGERVTEVVGELSDAAALERCAAGCQAAMHLVGIIAERGGQTFERVHVEGTAGVIGACRRAGVRRLVHMSALGSRSDAGSEYFRTKAAGERLVRESGLDWTIIRPSIIHGPDGEFLRMLVRFATGWGPMVTLGPGRAVVQPVWVEDVARAFVAALDRDGTIGRTIDLVGADAMTWNQMYRTVARVVAGREKRIFHLPVGLAKVMAAAFGVLAVRGPFNRDQVVMAQQDSTGDADAVEAALGFRPAGFEAALAGYRDALTGAREG